MSPVLCKDTSSRSSPLVRGVAMGCSAHSIGTAGLISLGDWVAGIVYFFSLGVLGPGTYILQRTQKQQPFLEPQCWELRKERGQPQHLRFQFQSREVLA